MTDKMDTNVYVGGKLRKAVVRHPLMDRIDTIRTLLSRYEDELMEGESEPGVLDSLANGILTQAGYLQ